MVNSHNVGINRELLLMTVIQFKGNEFGRLIKQKRKELRLKQKELCDRADIAVVYLSKIENGHQLPSQKIQKKLLDILDYKQEEPAEQLKEAVAEREKGILQNLYFELHKIFGKEKGENNVL
tara:strand:+ start:1737 stop:2102 length:366 start_codon:yes stop_codon:yes gene_type:complete